MEEQHKGGLGNNIKVIITTQCFEWYGCEDHVGEKGHGRYKAKGAETFTTWVPSEMYWYKEDAIKEAFDKQMYTDGEFFMYSAREVSLYYQPKEITLDLD